MAKTDSPKKSKGKKNDKKNGGVNATTIDNPGSGNLFFIILLGVMLIGGAAAVALLATGRDSDIGEQVDQTAEVTVEGDPIPPFEGSGISNPGNDQAVGTEAPSLSGTSFEEEAVSIEADGRPKAIYFLAHWCPHCQREVPQVQELIDDGKVPEGLDLYAVATGTAEDRPNFPPQYWLAREDFTPITMRDDATGTGLTSMGGAAFPYVVYLDGENNIVSRSSGELSPEQTVAIWEQTAAAGGASPSE